MRPLYRSKAAAPAKVQAALFFFCPRFRTFVRLYIITPLLARQLDLFPFQKSTYHEG